MPDDTKSDLVTDLHESIAGIDDDVDRCLDRLKQLRKRNADCEAGLRDALRSCRKIEAKVARLFDEEPADQTRDGVTVPLRASR